MRALESLPVLEFHVAYETAGVEIFLTPHLGKDCAVSGGLGPGGYTIEGHHLSPACLRPRARRGL